MATVNKGAQGTSAQTSQIAQRSQKILEKCSKKYQKIHNDEYTRSISADPSVLSVEGEELSGGLSMASAVLGSLLSSS